MKCPWLRSGRMRPSSRIKQESSTWIDLNYPLLINFFHPKTSWALVPLNSTAVLCGYVDMGMFSLLELHSKIAVQRSVLMLHPLGLACPQFWGFASFSTQATSFLDVLFGVCSISPGFPGARPISTGTGGCLRLQHHLGWRYGGQTSCRGVHGIHFRRWLGRW